MCRFSHVIGGTCDTFRSDTFPPSNHSDVRRRAGVLAVGSVLSVFGGSMARWTPDHFAAYVHSPFWRNSKPGDRSKKVDH